MDREKYISDLSAEAHELNSSCYLEFVTLRDDFLKNFDIYFKKIITEWDVASSIANNKVTENYLHDQLPFIIRKVVLDNLATKNRIWDYMSADVSHYLYKMGADFIKDELNTLEAQAMASLYF